MNTRLHRNGELLTRRAPVTGNSYDPTTRTFEATAATSEPVNRRDWSTGRMVREVLRIDAASVDLTRLAAGAPILNSHRAGSTNDVVGVVESARIEGGRLIVRGKLSQRDDVAGIGMDLADGILRNVSVGYRVLATERAEGASGQPDSITVIRWEPLEISLVAVGADRNAQIRSSDPDPVSPATGADQRSDPDLATREADRVATIRRDGERFRMPDLAAESIRSGASPEQFRAAVLERMAAIDEQHPIRSGIGTGLREDHMHISVTRDGDDTRRRAMTDAIAIRLAQAAARPGERLEVPEHARLYAGMGFAELAAECIGYRGNLRTARDIETVMERAFHTTSDFPAIFTNALNVRLLARYQIAPATYRRFSARYTVSDFRVANVIRAGDFPTLQPVLESGEIRHGTFGESKEAIQVFPYAVQFGITRQMIVNDQLSAINQVLGSAGDRVATWENEKMFALLLSAAGAGPTLLTDTLAVFHTTHGNLANPGTVIDVTNVGLARAAMRKQKSLDGLSLNLSPSVLLCGPDKETQAEQLLTSITPATNANAVPQSLRSLTVVADAAISGNPWYLFADPNVAPVFHYGYLEGFEGPRLSTKETWSVQGVAIKLEHDFGVAATDFRGAYRNPGA